MIELLSAKWSLVVARGFLGIAFGVLAVIWPSITLLTLVFLFGFYALIDGFATIFMGFSRRTDERLIPLATGGLGVLAGILVLAWPGISALVLLIFVAIWALIIGFGYLWSALRTHGEFLGRVLLGITGLAGVALGVALLVQPGQGAVALVFTIGFLSIMWGLFGLALGFRLRTVARRLESSERAATAEFA